jgi:hypothetical protein
MRQAKVKGDTQWQQARAVVVNFGLWPTPLVVDFMR